VELRKQREIDDILAYSSLLEKNYESLKKIDNIDFLVYNPKKITKLELLPQEKKKKINKNKIRKELLRKVRELALQLTDLNVVIRINSAQDHNIFRNKNKNITITYQETLNPELFPWYLIKIPGITTFEIYQVYKELVPNELIYSETILRKKHIGFKKLGQVEQPVVQEFLYCVCKQYKCDDIELVGKMV
jgi:hypothetical protein